MYYKIINYIELLRLNKPIGFLLLFFPCAYGIIIGGGNNKITYQYLIIFFIGSIIMRSAGCIINDYWDQEFDKKVERTKKRPLASGAVTNIEALILVIILLIIASILLLYLPYKAKILSVCSIIPIIIYPLIKRISYFPQFFLGFTFNLGLIIGFLSVNKNFNNNILIPYLGFVSWTIFYDTIYGLQDIKDDQKLQLKSFAIYLKEKKKFAFISVFGILFIILYSLSNMIFLPVKILNITSSIIITILLTKSFIKIYNNNYSNISLANIFEFQKYIGLLIIILSILNF